MDIQLICLLSVLRIYCKSAYFMHGQVNLFFEYTLAKYIIGCWIFIPLANLLSFYGTRVNEASLHDSAALHTVWLANSQLNQPQSNSRGTYSCEIQFVQHAFGDSSKQSVGYFNLPSLFP